MPRWALVVIEKRKKERIMSFILFFFYSPSSRSFFLTIVCMCCYCYFLFFFISTWKQLHAVTYDHLNEIFFFLILKKYEITIITINCLFNYLFQRSFLSNYFTFSFITIDFITVISSLGDWFLYHMHFIFVGKFFFFIK